MKLENKKVVVTGSEGFIGSHLVEALIVQGAEVTALVQYNSFNSWGWIDSLEPTVKNSIRVVSGDIREYDNIKKIIKGNDVVFHLAALIAIPYSYQSPMSYIRTNVEGTANVLEASRELNVEKVIHTSTSETYGSALYVPIDEKHPLQGQSPYSASKIGADMLAQSYHLSYELPVATLRPFNTYGPRQSSRAVIPTIISQISSGKKIIDLGDVTPTRDFSYVKDTVNAFLKVAESDLSIGKIMNAGSGKEISIGQLFYTICKLMGANVELNIEQQRIRPANSEVNRLLADNRYLKEVTGWESRYSLEDGLIETIRWIDKNINHYKPNIYNV
ncbi:NAD-dependent 4,6-dehydratase LegB [Fusibacter bizertensis]|uniref:NAD-dependent 4,6-dehydratase LegB n=1 Tax=Fusibacter bizertensis TaxID=1488331 RepID=A0ABT6NDV0_9FIRM|nr:NAD-dependent 4,6-dehydratase LegB [Fusibacter bizertensis]MDH8678586.1 NAD-dependent 4,6-dehydratase LegB [Fusibacter bizertensis]